MRTKCSKHANLALAMEVAEFTWIRWFLGGRSIRNTTIEARKAEYFYVVRCLAMQDDWTDFATHFWARLMERVRLSYCEVRNNFVQLTFMETVYGTFILACIAMLPEDHPLIWMGGRGWAQHFPIKDTRVNLLKNRVLKALDYNLELSRWTLAMDKVEREFHQLLGLNEALSLMRRSLKASQKLKRSREDGDKRGIDSSARNVRLLRRSLAKVRLELPDEIRVWNNIIDSVRSALHPMLLYGPLEIELSQIDLLVNEFQHNSYRVTYLAKS